jgi:alanyl-tRNA synthetase
LSISAAAAAGACCCCCPHTGVPAATSSKLKANEWVNAALSVLGGKGGGKPTAAQGQGSQIEKAADAAAAAEQFAAMNL